jgi:site-specific recombinase XerD
VATFPWIAWQHSHGLHGNIPVDWVAEIRGIRKGRKDRVVPLVKQAEAALKAYLKVRDAQPEYDEVFIARNGTSMDVRTVRYRIHKYYQEAGIKKKASGHTFSTHQIHNGLKLNQLKEVLGHRRMETTYKYVHLDRTNLRQEMEQGAL